ncbi:MAG: PRC-barrel domain-containing protein [Candidatus Pacearchaeota archaeon]
MMNIKRISEVIGKKVYSDGGDIIGVVEEINILDNKVDSWRVVVSKSSEFRSLLGGARGLIIPQKFIKSVGDVVLVSKDIVPIKETSNIEEEVSEESIDLS